MKGVKPPLSFFVFSAIFALPILVINHVYLGSLTDKFSVFSINCKISIIYYIKNSDFMGLF